MLLDRGSPSLARQLLDFRKGGQDTRTILKSDKSVGVLPAMFNLANATGNHNFISQIVTHDNFAMMRLATQSHNYELAIRVCEWTSNSKSRYLTRAFLNNTIGSFSAAVEERQSGVVQHFLSLARTLKPEENVAEDFKPAAHVAVGRKKKSGKKAVERSNHVFPALYAGTIFGKDLFNLKKALSHDDTTILCELVSFANECGDSALLKAIIQYDNFSIYRKAMVTANSELINLILASAGKADEAQLTQSMFDSLHPIHADILPPTVMPPRTTANAPENLLRDVAQTIPQPKRSSVTISERIVTEIQPPPVLSDTQPKPPSTIEEALALANEGTSPDTIRTLIAANKYSHVRNVISSDPARLKTALKSIAEVVGNDFIGVMLRHDNYLLMKHAFNEPPKTFEILLRAAKKYGDMALLTEILTFDNYAQLRQAVSYEHSNRLVTLVCMLPAECHRDAMQYLPNEWGAVIDRPKHEIWQEMGRGNDRWQAITGRDAPHQSLINLSPFNFSLSVYEAILPLFSLAKKLDDFRDLEPEKTAHKFAVLFSSTQEVERHLDRCAEEIDADESNFSRVINTAGNFSMPSSGQWDVARWKSLIAKYGVSAAARLQFAPRIENYLKSKNLPFPETPKQLDQYAAVAHYKRGIENPSFAGIAYQYSLHEQYFNTGLELLQRQRKARDHLPNVFINGDDLGQPGYYMRKLDIDDGRGLILGKITNCCQHIEHSMGGNCAKYGMTSEYSGFYVWQKSRNGQISDDDQIVAQSWAWISNEGHLVFDSFERMSDAYNKLCQPFIEQFAFEVAGKHTYLQPSSDAGKSATKSVIDGVRVGLHGSAATPRNIAWPQISIADDLLPENVARMR